VPGMKRQEDKVVARPGVASTAHSLRPCGWLCGSSKPLLQRAFCILSQVDFHVGEFVFSQAECDEHAPASLPGTNSMTLKSFHSFPW